MTCEEKKGSLFFWFVFSLLLGFAVFIFVLMYYSDKAETIVKAASAPEIIRKTFEVDPNYVMTYRIELRAEKLPGRLFGSWDSKGKSAQVPGAINDTIIRFRLLGPHNEVLQQLDDTSYGNFSIKAIAPGWYTFEFNNSGLLRSSKRIVTLEAKYLAWQ